MVDTQIAESGDDGTRTEEVFDRETQGLGIRLPCRDDRDARALATRPLHLEHVRRDGRGVAQASREHQGAGIGGGTGQRSGRIVVAGEIQSGAVLDRAESMHRQSESLHDDHHVRGSETLQAGLTPLETHLIVGLRVGGVFRHPSTLGLRVARVTSSRARHPSGSGTIEVMRILLKFVIDCDADAAWRALHSPRAVAELYGPLLDVEALGTMPTSFASGDDVPVQMSVAGVVPVGRQLISVADRETTDAHGRVRVFRDWGVPLTGPLAALDVWDHQMAVSAAPNDPARTLWRERLTIGGAAAPALWPGLWATWQWRAARIRALAPSWAYDPEDEATS